MRQKTRVTLFGLLKNYQSCTPKDCQYFKILSKSYKKELKSVKLSDKKWHDLLLYEAMLKSRVQQEKLILVLEHEFNFYKSHGLELPLLQKNQYIQKSLDNVRQDLQYIEINGVSCYCPHLSLEVNQIFNVEPANYQFDKYAIAMRSPILQASFLDTPSSQNWLSFIPSMSILRKSNNEIIYYHKNASILLIVEEQSFYALKVNHKIDIEELKKAILLEKTEEDQCFQILESIGFISNKVRRTYKKRNRGKKNEV